MKTPSPQQLEFKALYERYVSIIYSRCCRILKSKDEAWDATQDVFIKLMKSYDTIRDKKFLLAWLMKTTTFYCISQLRKRRDVEFDEEQPAFAGTVSPDQERMFSRRLIEKILAMEDAKTIEILLYTYVDHYTQQEIAQLTAMGESTIRKYLTRFRKKMRTWKETYGHEIDTVS
ncbi:MAG: RNA polymerase sigma factor [Chitinivibrionales bacterium]|nr:RNA polymerase sigma factor [Chitinivibrionales bacterium]